MDVPELTRFLRYRVTGLLHVGRARPGSRLPSIRKTAHLMDVDHRAVAAAYRTLEDEGLVEIRPGSGVYVTADEVLGPGLASATASWIADVLLEGWERRLSREAVADLVSRCASRRFTCACVDSVRDHSLALACELEDDLDLEVDRVMLGAEGEADADAVERIGEADLAVTLHFHAPTVERIALDVGTPLVVVSINPELTRTVEETLRRGPMTAVVEDPLMAERSRRHFGVTDHREAVRVVLADQVSDLESAGREGDTVLATRAARRALGGEDFHLVPPPPGFLARSSVRAVLEILAQLTFERASELETALG